jgi:hypothetical protein
MEGSARHWMETRGGSWTSADNSTLHKLSLPILTGEGSGMWVERDAAGSRSVSRIPARGRRGDGVSPCIESGPPQPCVVGEYDSRAMVACRFCRTPVTLCDG